MKKKRLVILLTIFALFTMLNFTIAEWRCEGHACWPGDCEDVVQEICELNCMGWGGCDGIQLKSRWCCDDGGCLCCSGWRYMCNEGSGYFYEMCAGESHACYWEWY